MEFKDKLFELRKASGLSQEEIAEKLGVSRQTISKWETGQSAPEMDKLPAISALFQVSLDYLLKPSEIDILSIKTMQLEAQQKEMESALRKKQKLSFLVVSIVVGLLAMFGGVMLISGMRFSVGGIAQTPMHSGGVVPALMFFVVGAVVVANYLHSRKCK